MSNYLGRLRFFDDEEWKKIEIPKGAVKKKYAVSNYGRIVSYMDRVEDGSFLNPSIIRGYFQFKLKFFNERFKSFHFIKSSVQLSSFFLLNCVDRFEARNNPAVSLYFGL